MHFSNQQSFWFRLWIGFLIGTNIAFAFLTAYILANEKLKTLIPQSQGVVFILLGLIDIIFMIQLLRWHKFGLYGTILVTIISLVLNLHWGADFISTILFAVICAGITLVFVIPNWSKYK